MAAYLIATLTVRDAQKFDSYRRAVPSVIAAHGGRYLVRGGALEVKEGAPPHQRVVVLEFPDMAAARKFYFSDDYKPVLEMRLKAGKSKAILVDGHSG